MRVVVVTDLVLADWVGGGTLVNDYLSIRLRQAGHSVSFICINSNEDGWANFDHKKSDIYLITNIPFMTTLQISELIGSGKPYLMFRHDIASICYLEQPALNPSAKIIEILFSRSRANIFISNIQLEYYKRVCEIPRVLVMPPPLDLDLFIDENSVERGGHLYIGEISDSRGIQESLQVIEKSVDRGQIDFYGQVTDQLLLAKINLAGGRRWKDVPHASVPALMNKYQHFYYHPKIIDAFCLKALEAELCGMTLHVNRTNIGRYYYDATARQLADFMKTQSVQMILQLLY